MLQFCVCVCVRTICCKFHACPGSKSEMPREQFARRQSPDVVPRRPTIEFHWWATMGVRRYGYDRVSKMCWSPAKSRQDGGVATPNQWTRVSRQCTVQSERTPICFLFLNWTRDCALISFTFFFFWTWCVYRIWCAVMSHDGQVWEARGWRGCRSRGPGSGWAGRSTSRIGRSRARCSPIGTTVKTDDWTFLFGEAKFNIFFLVIFDCLLF